MADLFGAGDPLAVKRKPGELLGAGAGGAAPPTGDNGSALYDALAGPVGDPQRNSNGGLVGAGAGGAGQPVLSDASGARDWSQPSSVGMQGGAGQPVTGDSGLLGAGAGGPAPPTVGETPPTPDPFTAMGGGTFVGGGWIPNNNPDAIAKARAAAGGGSPMAAGVGVPPAGPGAGGPAPPAGVAPPPGAPADPFAGSGGGEYFADTGQWIPKSNTAAITAARARTGAAAPAAGPTGPTGDPQRGAGGLLGAGAGGAAPPVGGAPEGPPKTVNDAFKTALMDRLTKPIGVDANDPTIKAQTDAFSNAQTRAKQRDRESMAGRAAATGQLSDLSSGGAFNEGLSALDQRQGESEAGFNANLTGQELGKQRDELYRYAALAGNQLSGEEGRALQEKLANLNAQIQREQMAQQGGQFGQDLALRSKLGEGQIGLGQGDLSLRGELGKGGLNLNLLQLLQGNQQFGQGLSAQLGMFGAGQDAEMWKALLGGLG